MIFLLTGHLQPLNILMVYRTVFASEDEAITFLKEELSAYTFFTAIPLSIAQQKLETYKGSILLVPVVPCKKEESK